MVLSLDFQLVNAARQGNLDVVEDFIETVANVNHHQTNEDGSPALMIAADKGHLAIVEILIATGSEVNLKDKDGDKSLNIAIKNHHQEIILALLN